MKPFDRDIRVIFDRGPVPMGSGDLALETPVHRGAAYHQIALEWTLLLLAVWPKMS